MLNTDKDGNVIHKRVVDTIYRVRDASLYSTTKMTTPRSKDSSYTGGELS
jgi:hypothetical protein